MTAIEAAALYAGLNILLLVALGVRVVGRRRSAGVSVGDGGDADLNLRIRTHGNASEYIPAFLVGLFMTASLGTPVWGVHALGGAFTLGRLLHAYGLSATQLDPRTASVLLT